MPREGHRRPESACHRRSWLRFVPAEIMEDVAESPAPPALQVSAVSPTSQEEEAYKRLGLTKQVLAAHTQKEEQAFLHNARSLQEDCFTHLHKQGGPASAAGTRLTVQTKMEIVDITHLVKRPS